MGSKMAYIVFDAGYSSIAGSDYAASYKALTGNKYMASFAAMNVESNDDWMISPILSGDSQTISFYARSYTTQYGNETFQVLYSTTGTDRDDFTLVKEVTDTPNVWTYYEADLPEGATHFAIRCTSADCFIFMVDDVTYIPGREEVELLGYNIYQDKVKLNDTPITTTEVAYNFDGATHSYLATVVYDKGESRVSNEVVLDPSGIDSALDDSIRISSSKGLLTIRGAAGRLITIATADGKVVYRAKGAEQTEIYLETGIYLVKVAERLVKIIVT
jgi:hypothetical protein